MNNPQMAVINCVSWTYQNIPSFTLFCQLYRLLFYTIIFSLLGSLVSAKVPWLFFLFQNHPT